MSAQNNSGSTGTGATHTTHTSHSYDEVEESRTESRHIYVVHPSSDEGQQKEQQKEQLNIQMPPVPEADPHYYHPDMIDNPIPEADLEVDPAFILGDGLIEHLKEQPLPEPPLPEKRCASCDSGAGDIIRVGPHFCPYRYYHYECLTQHLIDTLDAACEYPECNARLTDPQGRIERYLENPCDMTLMYRMLRDRIGNRSRRSYYFCSYIVAFFVVMIGIVPYSFVQAHNYTGEHVMTLIVGVVFAFFLLFSGLSSDLRRYRTGYPHRMLRLRHMADQPDGTLVIDITEERAHRLENMAHRRGQIYDQYYSGDQFMEEITDVYFPEDLEALDED